MLYVIYSQAQIFKNQEISISLGVGDENIEHITNEQLDFLNYAYNEPDVLDYGLFKLAYKFDFLDKMSANIQFDLIPLCFDISVYYHYNNKLYIGGGLLLKSTYIEDFDQYHKNILPDYYWLNKGSRDLNAKSLGIYGTGIYKLIDNNRFQINVKFDLGILSFLKSKANFSYKKKLSNERLHYHYLSKPSFQPFVRPKINLKLRFFNIKNTSVGMFLNSSYLFAKRRMKYLRTIEKWVVESSESKLYKLPMHYYSFFELNLGLYVKW